MHEFFSIGEAMVICIHVLEGLVMSPFYTLINLRVFDRKPESLSRFEGLKHNTDKRDS